MGGCLQYLSHGARWIMIAALAGRFTEIDLKNIYVRNVRIIGSTLRSRTPAFKAELLASLVKNVWPKVEEGLLKPSIYKVLPIQRAEEAHAILKRGGERRQGRAHRQRLKGIQLCQRKKFSSPAAPARWACI